MSLEAVGEKRERWKKVEVATKRLSRARMGLAVSVLFLLFFVPFGCMSLNAVKFAGESATWPTTTADVVKFESRGATCATESADWHRRLFCQYTLLYSYVVDGQSFQNDRVAFLGRPTWTEAGQQFDGKATISVAYHPEDPANSVALPGDKSWEGAVFTNGVETASMLAAIAFFLVMLRQFLAAKGHPDRLLPYD